MCLATAGVCIKANPRMGGLAIFMGFMAALMIFGKLDAQMLSILLGAMIIVVLGIFDDIVALGAKFKFCIQIIAAAIPVCIGGLKIEFFTSFNPFSSDPYFLLAFYPYRLQLSGSWGSPMLLTLLTAWMVLQQAYLQSRL